METENIVGHLPYIFESFITNIVTKFLVSLSSIIIFKKKSNYTFFYKKHTIIYGEFWLVFRPLLLKKRSNYTFKKKKNTQFYMASGE